MLGSAQSDTPGWSVRVLHPLSVDVWLAIIDTQWHPPLNAWSHTETHWSHEIFTKNSLESLYIQMKPHTNEALVISPFSDESLMSDLVRFLRPRWFRPLLELLVRAPSQSLGAGLSYGYWDLRRGRLSYNIRHGMQVDELIIERIMNTQRI